MKFKVFQRLKTKWLKNKKSIDNRKRLALKMQIRTFRYLEERWRYNKLLRAKFLEMMAGKDEYYLTMCFSCLKNWKQLKAELQRRSMPVHLDDHEYFKARFVMERWKRWHSRRVKIRETRAKLEAQQKEAHVRQCLIVWRTRLYLKQSYAHKAVPFHENVVLSNIQRRAFQGLATFACQRLERKESFRRAFEFYRFNLLSKSTEMLKWFRERQAERKIKVEFMEAQRNIRIKRDFVDLLQAKVIARRSYQSRLIEVDTKRKKALRLRFFILWYRTYQKHAFIKPQQSIVSKFFARNLLRRSLKKLYTHRTMSILKRNMKDTANNYQKEAILKKVFEQLLVYNYKQKAKHAMVKLADVHYKRNFMLRWIMLTQ